METRYLQSLLHNVLFYLFEHKESIVNSDKKISFNYSIKRKGIEEYYAILCIIKDKQIITTFKLSDTKIQYFNEYALEINLFMNRVNDLLKEHIKSMHFLHVCPECKLLHQNQSMYFYNEYYCNDCISRDANNNIEKKDSGHVYFFESELTGLIKIGYSGNIPRRKKQIEKMHGGKLNILKTVNINNRYEKNIHEMFFYLREEGEWFRPNKDLLDFIRNLSSENFEKYILY